MKTDIFLAPVLAALLLCACSSAESHTERNKETLRRAHAEVWSKGDLAAAEELYSPDYICHFIDGIEWVGLEGLKRQVAQLRSGFPDWNEHIEVIVAEGDLVVTRFTSTGTHLGEFRGLPPTGNKVRIAEVAVHRIENGKIVEQWGFPDVATMEKQLTGDVSPN